MNTLNLMFRLKRHIQFLSTACFSEELQRVLGFDWLLMFMQGHVHPTTVIQALRILLVMLRNNSAMNKFREGLVGGGWLKDAEAIIRQQGGGSRLGRYSLVCLNESVHSTAVLTYK